ncbi:MAG: hypothetical protein JNK66_07305, partial [Chitinophagales bacterium]|nr:hypothetical protein [Chitinophagales bacterium]
ATAQTVQITCSVFGNTVRACDTAVYVFSVTNFNKAFTITNIFSGAVTSAQLSATGSNFSLSGNNIVVNSFSGAAQTCTLKVYVACNAIPNSGSSNSFNDTVGISGWSSGNYNINGTPNNTSKIVNATFVYPNLDNSNTSTANVIVSPCKPDTLRLSYTNGGLSKFKGVVRFYNPVCTGFSVSTMRVFRRVGSNSTVVATLSNPYNNSTYRDVYFTNDTIGNLEQVEVEYVIGMSCTNGCINSATGVFPLTFNCAAQCAHDAQIKWGCDTNQLCKTTLKPIVIHPVIDSLPKLRLTRITPSPAANLGSVVGVWDAKCSGEDTEWKFLVENTGAGSCAIARNVVLSLFNNALDTNNNTYTRIVPGSIHILQDSVGGVALTLPAIPSSVVLDTVTVANPYTVFNASDLIESDCFSNSTGIITNYVVRIPELMPGQRLVLRFITRRCCASVSPFNTPIVYNRWQLSLTAKNYCGTGNNLAVNDSAHTLGTDSLYEPFVYQNNSPVKNAISNNFLENSSDLLLTQTLHAPTFVLMGGKGSCGPYINFEIANREFPTDKLNVYHGDTELFTHCSGPVTQSVAYGGFAGAMPRGLFTVQIPVPSGIDYDANTPAPLFKGTLSNGSIVNWTPQSWNPTANPPEAVFDIAQVANILGANFTTHDFRVFFLRSIFIFPLRACCPTSTNHADFAVNTFFTPRISCDSTTTNCQCRIPLSSVPVSVQLLCPGCVTPGMALGSYTLRRNTFGYTDSNDDRIADGSSPTTINPNTYPQASLLNTGASLAGDEIIAEADGWFQEGDDGTGFSYASWQNYWSQFSTDTVLTHLYLEQEAAHGATAGLQVNGTSTVVMLRDTGNGNWVQIGDTVHFANDTAHWQILNAANGKKLLTCHVTANEFHSTAVFKENDRFVWRIPYRVCKNTTGDTATTLQVSALLYLTLGAVSMPHGYYAGVPEVGAVYETAIDTLSPIPTPHAQFVPPSNNVLFFCQGNGWLHNVYPVVQETEENWETKNQCENIGWLIFKEKIAGAYPNLFRFEVRTLPDVQTLANGPAMSAAPFANIPVAYRVKLPNGFGYDQNLPTGSPAFLTSIHTRAPGWVNPLNPDILQSVVYPAASNSPIVYPAIHPTDSQRTYYINLSQTQYTVPTVSGIGGNYTTTPPPPDQDGPFPQQITVNGKKGLLLGDEEFYQAALFKLRAICSSSDTLANIGKMFPSDNYIIAKQIDSCSGAGNGSWGLTQPTAAIQIPIPNPNITASLGNSSSQTPNIDGFYADLPFKVVVPPNAVENVIIYIDLPPTAVVQPVCLSTGAGCTGTVYPPNTTTNGWLRYSIGAKPNGTFPFWLRVQTLGCDSGIVKFNAHISWDCDGEPLNLPPLPTMCSTPDTLSFSYLRPQVQTTATATGNPTTFNGCSPTTYKACLTSTKLGGVGHISATVNFGTAAHLLSTVTADSLKVNGTTLPLAHTTNTTSLLYNLTTNSGHNISQFTPPASLLHNDGLNNNDGELCLYFNI